MKKKTLLVILGIITTMALTLTACGNRSEEAVQQEETKTPSEEDEQDEEAESAVSDEEAEVEPEEKNGVLSLHLMTGWQYDSYYSDAYSRVIASVSYPSIQLESCCTQEYPEIAQVLADLSAARKGALMDEFEYMIEQSAIQLQEMGEEYFETFETSERATVRRADSNIVSILMDCYYYGGGVHGMPYNWGYTYDVKTGQELALTDVVNDISVLPQYVQAELNKYYEPEIFFEGYDLNSYFSEYLESVSWVLDYNGLTIIFNPYDIAPFASGSQTVTLSFAEYPDLVKTEYQQVPENYGIEISDYDAFFYDVDGDGVKDELSVFGVVSDYDRIEKHAIIIDERRFEVETDGYSIEPVLIHMADGSNYLYIQDTTDNDYRGLSIYKFTADGAVEFVGMMDNAGWYTQMIENADYLNLEQALTDPMQFRLEGRTDVLSTLSGYKNYQISKSGMPVSDEQWFTHTSSRYLTLLQPLEVDVIDEKTGEKTGTTTLSAGTKVLYYRTDDATFADLKLTDGTVVRVMVNMDEWPRTVNGIDIEAIFDGMMFAG